MKQGSSQNQVILLFVGSFLADSYEFSWAIVKMLIQDGWQGIRF